MAKIINVSEAGIQELLGAAIECDVARGALADLLEENEQGELATDLRVGWGEVPHAELVARWMGVFLAIVEPAIELTPSMETVIGARPGTATKFVLTDDPVNFVLAGKEGGQEYVFMTDRDGCCLGDVEGAFRPLPSTEEGLRCVRVEPWELLPVLQRVIDDARAAEIEDSPVVYVYWGERTCLVAWHPDERI